MGGSPASPASWKRKLRRLVAAPFRFLLREDLARLEAAERALASLHQAWNQSQEAMRNFASEQAAHKSEIADLRKAYLTTRAEFEEVRDGRLPRVEADFGSFQKAFSALQGELEQLRDVRLLVLEKAAQGLQGAFDELQGELEQLRDVRLLVLEKAAQGLQGAFDELQGELEQLRDVRLLVLEKAAQGLQGAFDELQGELIRLRDEALPRVEKTQAQLQTAHDALLLEVETLRDQRLPQAVQGLHALHTAVEAVQGLAEEIRDQRLPAASARLEALIERLFEEITVTRSLVDRILYEEPLQIPAVDQAWEEELPEAIRRAWLRFLEAHRGSRQEILVRASQYVEVFRGASPVLDLGCGRGELLEALTRAGIEAFGVDSDAAAVAECRRRGLKAEVRDALEALSSQPEGSLGGVACIHLIEHLSAARWMKLFEQAARVLRPGGILAVESPNPETLRVGAGLFWVDPTHLRPVHPEAARFVAEAVGLEVLEIRKLRPFPPEQQLSAHVENEKWRAVLEQLDLWLSGCRDYLLVAKKPNPETRP